MSTPAAQYAFQFYLQRGYSPAQAAGIVGNLMQESGPGLNTTIAGDNGTSFGAAQWRGNRLAGLKAFAQAAGADWRNLDVQLAFVDHELRTSESAAGKALRAATTVPEAVAAMIGYERPAGWSASNPTGGHGWTNRLNNALAVAGMPGSVESVLGDPSLGPAGPTNARAAALAAATPPGGTTIPPATPPANGLGDIFADLAPTFDTASAGPDPLALPGPPITTPSQPSAVSMAADASAAKGRQLVDSLLPVAEQVSTSGKPIDLSAMVPMDPNAPPNPLAQFFSRPKPAALKGGTRILA